MARMRTIKEAITEIKEQDPRTALTEHQLRRLIVSGKLPSVSAGRKYLINMEVLESYLHSGVTA